MHTMPDSARGLTKRELATLSAGALASALARPELASSTPDCTSSGVSLLQGMQRLRRAYPNVIAAADEHALLWRDGTQMPVTLFPLNRPPADRIRNPDLAAQVMRVYPQGHCALPGDPADDPGRVRYDPYFRKMYGTNQFEVAAKITRVPWPTRRPGGWIEFSRVNGAADRLHKVAGELAALPSQFHKYFDNPAGGFYWRPIAGTNRLSGHAFGIAVDINVRYSHYWRNELPRGPADEPDRWQPTRRRNFIPFEIVDVFERHGFIWGGKWYHYDTMHFEYRPEFFA